MESEKEIVSLFKWKCLNINCFRKNTQHLTRNRFQSEINYRAEFLIISWALGNNQAVYWEPSGLLIHYGIWDFQSECGTHKSPSRSFEFSYENFKFLKFFMELTWSFMSFKNWKWWKSKQVGLFVDKFTRNLYSMFTEAIKVLTLDVTEFFLPIPHWVNCNRH